MKHESSQRVLLSMTLLAMLWVVVYWSWGPGEVSSTITFDRPVPVEVEPQKDAEQIKAGDLIRLPVDPGNIQEVLVDASEQQTTPSTPPAPEYVKYVIQSGDTLSEISQRYYGTFKNARLIFEANRDTLRSMDDLRLGETIRLPAAPGPGG